MQRLKKVLGTSFKALLSITALAMLAVCVLFIIMYFSPPKDPPWDREYRLDYEFSAAIGVMGSDRNRALVDKIAIICSDEHQWYDTLKEVMAQSPYIATNPDYIQKLLQQIDYDRHVPYSKRPCDHKIAEMIKHYHLIAFDETTRRNGYLRLGVCLDSKYIRVENRNGAGVYEVEFPALLKSIGTDYPPQ